MRIPILSTCLPNNKSRHVLQIEFAKCAGRYLLSSICRHVSGVEQFCTLKQLRQTPGTRPSYPAKSLPRAPIFVF